MIRNTITTSTGRQSAVCEFCDRQSRPVVVERESGRLSLWDLANGWSTSPYPLDFVHADGSTGALWTCPSCNRRLDRGESVSVTPERLAAIRAHRAGR